MRKAVNKRNLSIPEQNLAVSVFGSTLPAWSLIFIDDGLGLGDAPWTYNPGKEFTISLGPVGYPDATSLSRLGAYGVIRNVFIHEMTHVWQYFHGYNVKLSSVWCHVNVLGDGYDYELGKSWDDYNVEQQASIVEDWFKRGLSPTDPAFTYIDQTIHQGIRKR